MGSKVELPPQQEQRPIRLPLAGSQAVQFARDKTLQDIAGRGGRQSTILSQALRSLTGSIGFLGR